MKVPDHDDARLVAYYILLRDMMEFYANVSAEEYARDDKGKYAKKLLELIDQLIDGDLS